MFGIVGMKVFKHEEHCQFKWAALNRPAETTQDISSLTQLAVHDGDHAARIYELEKQENLDMAYS